jgi:Protein of unknown function (DUF1203)
MSFRIQALPFEPFARYFTMSSDELRTHRALIRIADKQPGFPCRVSLDDAAIGERVLLANFEHLATESPYRSTHAVYVRESAVQKSCARGEVPSFFHSRLLSARAFDAAGLMIEADVLPGTDLAARIEAMLTNQSTSHVDIHFAKPGCFAARAVRD